MFLSKFRWNFAAFLVVILISSSASAAELAIHQKSGAFIAQPIKFEASGDLVISSDVEIEWLFSNNVRAVSIGDRGRSCTFTVNDDSPIAISVRAMGKGKLLNEVHMSTKALPIDIKLNSAAQQPIQIWDSKKRQDEPAKGLAVNQKLSFSSVISPDVEGTVYYKWNIAPESSFDVSENGSNMTFWRKDTGLSLIDVTISNAEGVVLGKGEISVDIVVSQAEINRSNRQRSAWEKLQEALNMWNASNFSTTQNYSAALELVVEAQKLDPDDAAIAAAFERMSRDSTSILRAKGFADEGEEMRKKSKWTESLNAYRRSVAAWRFPEAEKAMAEVQEIVLNIRTNRDKALWLREMAKAHEAERRYAEAIESYRESMKFDGNEEASNGIKRLEEAEKKAKEAEKLNEEANALLLSGDHSGAINRWEKSLKLQDDKIIARRMKDIEAIVNERKASAARIKREGNEHAKRGRNAQALACYIESLSLWHDQETETFMKRFERLVPQNERIDKKDQPNLAEAEKFVNEGHEFYRAGRYKEALERYKKGYEIDKSPQLEGWITRVESGIKAQASIDEANRLIREANALYAIRQYKEALDRYKASLELYPNSDVERFIPHIEEILSQK